jgi:hypothetical protein
MKQEKIDFTSLTAAVREDMLIYVKYHSSHFSKSYVAFDILWKSLILAALVLSPNDSYCFKLLYATLTVQL